MLPLGRMHLSTRPDLRAGIVACGLRYIFTMFHELSTDVDQDINLHLRNCKIDFLKSEVVYQIASLGG